MAKGKVGKMGPEPTERIILAVSTNLNTRLVVIPLRPETIAEIRATIKAYHMNLFPDRGEVEVNYLEVEVFGERCRMADPIPIGQFFVEEKKAQLFAELISLSSNTLSNKPSLINPTGVAQLRILCEHELEQHPDEHPRQAPPEIRGQGNDTLKAGEKQETSQGIGVAYDMAHGMALNNTPKVALSKRSLTNSISEDTDRGVSQACGQSSDAVERQARKKRKVEKQENLNHVEESSQAAAAVEVVQQLGSSPGTEKVQKEPKLSPSKPIETDTAAKSSGGLEFWVEFKRSDGSGSSGKSDHPVIKKEHEEPTGKDSVAKSLVAVGSVHRSSTPDGSDSSSQSDHPVTKKLLEEPGVVTLKRIKKDNLGRSSSRSRSGSDASGSSTQSGPPIGSQQKRNTWGQQGGRTTYGGSTGQSSGQSEDSRKKNMDVQVKHGPHNNGNSVESAEEEGSKSFRPLGSSTGKDSDEEVSSESNSSSQSSDRSENDNQQSASDRSEEMPPSGSRRRMDFSTPEDGGGAVRSTSRRSIGGSLDLKYQHLLDSQDGFDELISLSQLVSKGIPGDQPELQLVNELHDSQAPVPLANDSLSIDLVPDTQDPGGWNGNAGSQEALSTMEGALEGKIKEAISLTMDIVNVGSSVARKDSVVPAEPVQDGVEDGGKFKSSPLSVKIGELMYVKEESIAIIGNVSDRIQPESGEEPPQVRSDDCQQICAAVQLARMSMAEGADVEFENSPSKKRMTTRKQGVASPDGHAVIGTQESMADVSIKGQNLQFIRQAGKSPARDLSAIVLPEHGSQRLETTSLLSPNPNMEERAENGDVLPMLETRGGATVHLTEEVAADALVGKKKVDKRRHKELQAPQEDIRGHPGTVEDDEQVRGDSVLLKKPADAEHSRRASTSEFQDDLHSTVGKEGGLATTTLKAVEKKKLTLKQKVHKSPRKDNKQRDREEPLELTSRKPNKLVSSGLQDLSPHTSVPENSKALHEERPLLENGELHDQRKASELRQSSGQARKKKKAIKDKAGQGGELHVELNMMGSAQNIEPGNIVSEVASDQVLTTELRDIGIGEDHPLVTGNATEFGSAKHSDDTTNNDTQKEKRRFLVGSTENLSRPKRSRKKDPDARQDKTEDDSAVINRVVAQIASDKSLLEGHDTEEEELAAKEDEIHRNNAEDGVAEVGLLAAVVLDEKKKHRKKGGAPNAPKSVQNLETSVRTNQKARQTQNKEDIPADKLGDVMAESEKADKEPIATLGKEGAEMVPSSLGKRKKTKKKGENLKISNDQSVLDFTEEMEPLDDPTAFKMEGKQAGNSMGGTPNEQTPKRKKRKKTRDLENIPSAEGENRKVLEVQSIDSAEHEEEHVAPEDEAAAQHSPEAVRSPSLRDSNARKVKKRSSSKGTVEEDSLHAEDTNKEAGLKKSPSLLEKKLGQVDQAKPKKSKKGDAGGSSKPMKRNGIGRSLVEDEHPKAEVSCPHGCGKRWSRMTSAYYRHKKTCFLGRAPEQ